MAVARALLGILLVLPLSMLGLAKAGEAISPVPQATGGLMAPSPEQTGSLPQELSTLVQAHAGVGLSHRSLVPAEEELGHPNRFVATMPYPDVDKDGFQDVLELDLDLRDGHPIYGFKGTLGLTTLSGRNGKALGRHTMPFDSGVPWVYPMRLGKGARPGVLVVLDRWISSPEHPTNEFIATAVSAKGQELWSKEIIGTSTSTPTRWIAATDVVFASDLLQAPGQSDNVLLNIYDYAGGVLTLTPAILDGVTGELTEQLPIAVPWVDGTPVAIGAPDLDRDLDLGRRDDVLVVDTTGLRTGIMARSSSTGEELWHHRQIPSGDGLMTAHLKNVTGDSINDFAIGAPLRLLDGATGDAAWERPGGRVVLTTGRADGDKKLDLLTLEGVVKEKRFGATVQAITSTGKLLGRGRFMTERSNEGHFATLYDLSGDVNGDGVSDAFVWLIGDGRRHISVDGASGNRLLEAEGLHPLRGSIDGDAEEELMTIIPNSKGFVLTARDVTGRTLWRTNVVASKDYKVSWVHAVGGSVILTVYRRSGAITYALDVRSGRVKWTRVLQSESKR